MHIRQLLFFTILIRVSAQQPASPSGDPPAHVFQVLEQVTVPQKDGGSVTFKRVEPPVEMPYTPPPTPVLTPAELARQQELDAKTSSLLSISASVHPQGLTVLRWSCDGSQTLQAVCNVNFRYLAGLGNVETHESWYSLLMSVGTTEELPPMEAASVAPYLPANGAPTFVLFQTQGSEPVNFEDAPAIKARVALQALLDHFAAHKAELLALHAQREAEAQARELAARNAPPPQPKHSVTHFWPLQPAQRAAIDAKTQAQAQEGGAQP